VVSLQLQTTLAAEEQKLLACIHCGLCLEACPTYVVTGDENDGPRGRLYLMRAVGEGRLSNQSTSFKNHIDRCLGCRACEQVCPAGVQYGQLLEAARSEIVTAQPPKGITGALLNLALRRIWPKPARLKLFFATSRIMRDLGVARLLVRSRIARLFSKRIEFAFALLDSSRPQVKARSFTTNQTAEPSRSVLLFSGCVGEGLFAHVNRATERVLRANGFGVTTPEQQVCCGALHAHAGDLDGARELARQNITAFASEKNIPIITNAGGCGAMLISYSHLLADDDEFAETAETFSNRVKDVAQQLDNANIEPSAATTELVTYDASCHLLYGQRAADSSLRMLRSIDDLNFVELKGAERCCGAAGIYNLLQPELSGRVLREKLTAVAESGANVLTTGNAGCQMQIGAGACLSGMKLNTRHPVELLDESYARAGIYSREDPG
jgi:glycolate oxidase iron-sulfur subunit